MSSIIGANQYTGNRNVALTSADLEEIGRKDPGLYNVGFEQKLRNAYFFTLPLFRLTAAGTKAAGGVVTADFPFLIFRVEACCEASAGTAGIVELERALAATPSTWVLMTSAAINVHATIGEYVAGTMLEAQKTVAFGDKLRIAVTGTGGNVTNSSALLHCVRL